MSKKLELKNMNFGEKIRKLRLSKGLTQEEVAVRGDLARSFISQIETDKTSPTLENLGRILKAVGSDYKSFFSDHKPQRIVYRNADRVPMYDEPNGISSELLMDAVENKKIDAIITEMKPNSATIEEDYHEGDEFGYILLGNIELILDGKSYKLSKNDCFYFKADKKHMVINSDPKRSARVLWIKID